LFVKLDLPEGPRVPGSVFFETSPAPLNFLLVIVMPYLKLAHGAQVFPYLGVNAGQVRRTARWFCAALCGALYRRVGVTASDVTFKVLLTERVNKHVHIYAIGASE